MTMREGAADAMSTATRDDAPSPSLLTWCFTSFHRFSTKAQEVLQVLALSPPLLAFLEASARHLMVFFTVWRQSTNIIIFPLTV